MTSGSARPASATGARTSSGTSTSSPSSPGSCDTDAGAAGRVRARYLQARVTAASTRCSPTTRSTQSSIATPVPTHYELAQRALEAGKHVFVEKPPAMRGEEMEELVDLARAHDLVLMPGHLLLYHPGVCAS